MRGEGGWAIEADLRALIRQMSLNNPFWGAPRIHGELLKLGFEVVQSTVPNTASFDYPRSCCWVIRVSSTDRRNTYLKPTDVERGRCITQSGHCV